MADPDPPTSPEAEASSAEVGYAHSHFLIARHVPHWHGFLVVSLLVGGCALALILVRAALTAAGLGSISSPAGWCVVAAIAAWVIHWRDALPHPSPHSDLRIEHDPDDSKRIWCVWQRWRLQRLAGQGPIVDETFEPEVFAAPFAIRPSAWMCVAWLALAAAAFSVIYVFLRALSQGPTMTFNFMTFAVAMALGWFTVTTARPTSIRIVPGRIDVMRGWVFSPRRPVIRTIDLRRSRLVLDLRTGILFSMRPAGDQQDDVLVALGSGRVKARIAHAILRAAVSTAEAPPLPDAEVVG